MGYTIEQARALLGSSKLKEAGKAIDSLLGKDKNNDELWYLRGIVSLRLKNYDNAHECFEQATWINKKSLYFKMMGLAHMEMYEFDDAVEDFEHALSLQKKDASLNFYLSVCYLFLNDLRGKKQLQVAYSIDKKKTKRLAEDFYTIFFKSERTLNEKIKQEIERTISSIKIV